MVIDERVLTLIDHAYITETFSRGPIYTIEMVTVRSHAAHGPVTLLVHSHVHSDLALLTVPSFPIQASPLLLYGCTTFIEEGCATFHQPSWQ